jgi:hypothetical protein
LIALMRGVGVRLPVLRRSSGPVCAEAARQQVKDNTARSSRFIVNGFIATIGILGQSNI